MRRKRGGMWSGYWTDPHTGKRLARATRKELAIAYQLWAEHADIRLGRHMRGAA